MEQWEFIEKAALALKVEAETFRKWRSRGVPHQWRLAIVDAAHQAGFILDRAEFDNPPGPKRNATPDDATAPELREAS